MRSCGGELLYVEWTEGNALGGRGAVAEVREMFGDPLALTRARTTRVLEGRARPRRDG